MLKMFLMEQVQHHVQYFPPSYRQIVKNRPTNTRAAPIKTQRWARRHHKERDNSQVST